MVHAFHDEEATLMCPFIFGNLREYFDPNKITWRRQEFGQFPVTLAEPGGSFQISPDGRELHLLVTNPATYQCRLILSRCAAFDENNDVSDRCQVESPFMGPVTIINVLGTYEVQINLCYA